jgi:hypothetical protein
MEDQGAYNAAFVSDYHYVPTFTLVELEKKHEERVRQLWAEYVLLTARDTLTGVSTLHTTMEKGDMREPMQTFTRDGYKMFLLMADGEVVSGMMALCIDKERNVVHLRRFAARTLAKGTVMWMQMQWLLSKVIQWWRENFPKTHLQTKFSPKWQRTDTLFGITETMKFFEEGGFGERVKTFKSDDIVMQFANL